MSTAIPGASQVQAIFNDQAATPQRLHHIMAHHEFDGDPDKLSRAVDLVQKIGKVSLEQQSGEGNWTPLEVAVLSGYSFGIEFLIQKGVEPSARALELAHSHHPELLPLLGVEEHKDFGAAEESKEVVAGEISSIASEIQGISPHMIHVGQLDVAEALQEILKEVNPSIQVQCHPLAQKDRRAVLFIQDGQVVLPDGTFLIPYAFQEPDIEYLFRALLSLSSQPFVTGIRNGFGEGFQEKQREITLKSAEENGIFYQCGKTCIEGGNCRFTTNAKKEKVAIIGEHSLVLSFLALEEQGYFEKSETFEKRVAEVDPSLEDLRLAKNYIYAQKVAALNKGIKEGTASREAFRKAFQSPTHIRQFFLEQAKDVGAYENLASSLHVKLQMARELMAQELGVDPQNLALVQQGHFHVDMDLFTHGSTVYMNNAEPHKDKSIYYEHSVGALLKAEESRLQWNQSILEGAGLTVCLVPGVDEKRGINFMNGFVLPTDEGPVYITNGVSRRWEVLKRL